MAPPYLCLYIDNLRGFKKQYFPFGQVTFLTGENSTGKTSCLRVLRSLFSNTVLDRPVYTAPLQMERDGDSSVFEGVEEDAEFTIGVSGQSRFNRDEHHGLFVKYKRIDERIKITRVDILTSSARLAVSISQKRNSAVAYYKTFTSQHFEQEWASPNPALSSPHWKKLKVDSRHGLYETFGLRFTVNQLYQDKLISRSDFEKFFLASHFQRQRATWVAPIRIKPQRFYDGRIQIASPEGTHVPLKLKQALDDSEHGAFLLEWLRRYGYESGLFDEVVVNSFRANPDSPFEILLKLGRNELTIDNVGYGVSQILPVLVELMTATHGDVIFLQQPEVHLHPRAQAAFGDLVAEVAKERKLHLLVETHSDFLIDRFRLNLRKSESNIPSNLLFFQKKDGRNNVSSVMISPTGEYLDQPREFREFFVRESLDLFDL